MSSVTCPNCTKKLAATDKFCPECGTRRSIEGDDEKAFALINTWMGNAGYASFNHMTARDKRDALATLAKARELLVAPLEQEIARLKDERDGAKKLDKLAPAPQPPRETEG